MLLALILPVESGCAHRGVLRGRVADERGHPVPEAVVTAMTVSERRATTTDGKGSYRLRGLAPGQYDIVVTGDALRPARMFNVEVVAPGARHQDVVLPDAATSLAIECSAETTCLRGVRFDAAVPHAWIRVRLRGATVEAVSQDSRSGACDYGLLDRLLRPGLVGYSGSPAPESIQPTVDPTARNPQDP